jgi:hypothetical protein
MNKFWMGLAGSLFLAILIIAAPNDIRYSGEIMDSACAKESSHADMQKKEGLAGKDLNDPAAKKLCTRNCVSKMGAKYGAKYVLFNPLTGVVYQLDDQTKSANFAGEKVKVSGTLDKTTDTIHVADVQSAS